MEVVGDVAPPAVGYRRSGGRCLPVVLVGALVGSRSCHRT